MAAFGLSVAEVPDPAGDVTLGSVLSGVCSHAAGIRLVALSADD